MNSQTLKLRLNLDSEQFKSKPSKSQTGIMRDRLAKSQTEVTIEELAQAIEQGRTFTPALNLGTKADTWQEQQIIAVDIDNDVKKQRLENPLQPVEAMEILYENQINPAIIYQTFSNSEDWPRFRILIALDEPIKDQDTVKDYTARLAQLMNMARSGCADTSIGDAARLLYGGSPDCVLFVGEETTPAESFEMLPAARNEQPQNLSPAPVRIYRTSSDEYILEALEHIQPRNLTYEEWLKVGTALKSGGFTVDVWDSWSKNDDRYKNNDCLRRWKGLNVDKVKVGTIIHLAQKTGWEPSERLKSAYREARKAEMTDAYNAVLYPAPEYAPADGPAPDPVLEDSAEPLADAVQDHDEPQLTTTERFILKAESEAFKPIPTGIQQFDELINGGFIRQTLVTLGASPGAGKTMITQQIMEAAARSGNATVRFFNLEMSSEQLLARSLSRAAGMSQTDVMRGYAWTEEQRNRIVKAASEYEKNVATGIKYNPSLSAETKGSAFYQDIIGTLEAEANMQKTDLPMIAVIDYLQLLRDANGGDDVETIKSALKAFKDFAIRRNAIVFLIMAHSRATNTTGIITQGAGRDTSAIEYSADLQMSLNYGAVADGTFGNLAEMERAIYDPNNTRADGSLYDYRCLSVTKNRFGPERSKCYLTFNGEKSKFDFTTKCRVYTPRQTAKPRQRVY